MLILTKLNISNKSNKLQIFVISFHYTLSSSNRNPPKKKMISEKDNYCYPIDTVIMQRVILQSVGNLYG